MMNQNELRIGNLVTNEFYESFCDIIKVESIHEGGINVIASDDDKPYGMAQPLLDFEYTFDKLKPIPLTEEWLLKFGFLKDDRKSKHAILSTMYFLGHGLKLWSIINGTRFRHDFNCDYLTGINIDYVHQLQNLVFTLTGEELKLPANEKKTTS